MTTRKMTNEETLFEGAPYIRHITIAGPLRSQDVFDQHVLHNAAFRSALDS